MIQLISLGKFSLKKSNDNIEDVIVQYNHLESFNAHRQPTQDDSLKPARQTMDTGSNGANPLSNSLQQVQDDCPRETRKKQEASCFQTSTLTEHGTTHPLPPSSNAAQAIATNSLESEHSHREQQQDSSSLKLSRLEATAGEFDMTNKGVLEKPTSDMDTQQSSNTACRCDTKSGKVQATGDEMNSFHWQERGNSDEPNSQQTGWISTNRNKRSRFLD